MAGEWEETTLADVSSDVSYGYTESASDEKVGPRFLRITDIQNGVVNWANVPYCTISSENHEKYRLQEGDIVVARTGNSTGENFLYRGGEDAIFASYLIRFRIDCQKADPGFVWYNLRSRDWWNFINNSKTGSAQAGANAKILGFFPLNLPPFSEQRAIAHILGTLDDKIELNRRMNETLEAMARALFKSWFIDFDPVRRNAARARNQPSPPTPLPVGEGRLSGRGEGAKHEGEGRHYRGGYDFSGLLETARELRRKHTPAEDLFWELVRDRQFMGFKFRRQHQLGDYIADFYCHEHRLVIEMDGGVHSIKQKKDHKRGAWMEAQGFMVLRFSNEKLLDDPESVLATIASTFTSPSSSTSGRGQGEGSVDELDRLFPDSFEDSELGEIPEGWEVKSIGDLADVVGGTTPSTKQPAYWDDGVHAWATPKDLSGLAVPVLLDTERRITDAGLSQVGSGLLPKGTVLLSSRAPIGYLAIAEIPVAINQGFIAMMPKARTSNLFLLFWASVSREKIASRANGSTFLEISKGNFRPIPVVTPTANVMHKFNQLARPLYERIVDCARESRTLSTLRDALLPKLISGELRVNDAERFVREVT